MFTAERITLIWECSLSVWMRAVNDDWHHALWCHHPLGSFLLWPYLGSRYITGCAGKPWWQGMTRLTFISWISTPLPFNLILHSAWFQKLLWSWGRILDYRFAYTGFTGYITARVPIATELKDLPDAAARQRSVENQHQY